MTSKQLIERYRILNFWRKGLYNAIYQQTSGIDNEGNLRYQTIRLVEEIDQKLQEIFNPEIGKAITYEVRVRE